MGSITDLIARIHEGNEEEVGQPVTAPVVPEAPVVDVPKETPLVEPAIERVAAPKPKRGRKTVYEVEGLDVGEYIVYRGKLESGRVLASLKGKDNTKKFHATVVEVEGVPEVRISRKS